MNSKKNIITAAVIAVLSLIAVGVVYFSLMIKSDGQLDNTMFYSMDTYIEARGSNEARKTAREVFDRCDGIFDFHDETSELSKLNAMGKITASEELTDAVSEILTLNGKYGSDADITVGALTRLWDINGDAPRIPSDSDIKKALDTVGYSRIKVKGRDITLSEGTQLDMGCAAKGAALDIIKKKLDSSGDDRTIISAGGSSILLYGDGDFSTGIQSPDDDTKLIGKIITKEGFISTSGGYHRFAEIDGKKYSHILDTKTGAPSETDLTSVTVFCQSGIDSDFLSTLIFTGGTKKIADYLDDSDILVLALDKDKRIYKSPELEFELADQEYSYASEDK